MEQQSGRTEAVFVHITPAIIVDLNDARRFAEYAENRWETM